jgi:drug/metabolite transporter (DMT)-like permease
LISIHDGSNAPRRRNHLSALDRQTRPAGFRLGSSPSFVTKVDDVTQILPLIGVAIAGLSSHFCLTNAFRNSDATIVVPLDFLRIPLIALIGWSVYGEPLDAFVFVGAAIIITGIVWNLRAEATRK